MRDPVYEFGIRTRLQVGPGSSAQAGALASGLGLSRVFLVTDPGLMATPHVQTVRQSLETAGLQVTVYHDVSPNPTVAEVERCLAAAQAAAPDGFVALGGGSAMDTAKAANMLLTNGGAMADYHGRTQVQTQLLPLLAIPTTAGTGSEMQAFALVSDTETHVKMACGTDSATPAIAILDPVLTLTSPPDVTASAGVDALTHALECAVTRVRTPLSLMLARDAFGRLIAALPRVLGTPDDLAARQEMLLGACLAGAAIENSMLGAAHATANPLTAHFGLVHGMAVAATMPAVIAYNRADLDCATTYAQLAVAAELADADDGLDDAIDALLAEIDRIWALLDVGGAVAACQPDPTRISQLAQDATGQWTGTFNPRPLELDDFAGIYRQTFDRWLESP